MYAAKTMPVGGVKEKGRIVIVGASLAGLRAAEALRRFTFVTRVRACDGGGGPAHRSRLAHQPTP
jgi:predicted NAD/FAD-dependent oxidoreductase